MALHRDLPDSELHEPKGVVSASGGDVYVADGAGGGDWKNNFAYGMLTINSDKTFSVTGATDTTLNSDSDYVAFSSTGLWSSATGYEASFDTAGTITLPNAGFYEISLYVSLETNTANNTNIAFKFGQNGVLSDTKLVDTFKATGEVHSVAASSIVSVNSGDVFTLYVVSDASQTLTVSDAKFFVRMLKAA